VHLNIFRASRSNSISAFSLLPIHIAIDIDTHLISSHIVSAAITPSLPSMLGVVMTLIPTKALPLPLPGKSTHPHCLARLLALHDGMSLPRDLHGQCPIILSIGITSQISRVIRSAPIAAGGTGTSLPSAEATGPDVVPAAIAPHGHTVLGVVASVTTEALPFEFAGKDGVAAGEAPGLAFLGSVTAGLGAKGFEGEGAVGVFVGVAAQVGGGGEAGALEGAGRRNGGGGRGRGVVLMRARFGFWFDFDGAKVWFGGGDGRGSGGEDEW